MGLKDQLIQRANEGGKKSPKQEPEMEEFNQDVDLRQFFDDEDDVMAPSMFGESDDISFDNDEGFDLSNAFEEPEQTIPEPIFEQPMPQPQPQYQPQYQPQAAPAYQPQYQPQPQYQAAPEPIMEQPSYQPQYQPVEEPMNNYNNVNNSSLEAKLLQKAKANVLNSITEEFTSSILTGDALSKLVTSYLDSKSSDMTNSNYVFVAVIDEIIKSEYTHSYYQELTLDILESVKNDLL